MTLTKDQEEKLKKLLLDRGDKITDAEIHAFADEVKVNIHELEAYIYKIAAKHLGESIKFPSAFHELMQAIGFEQPSNHETIKNEASKKLESDDIDGAVDYLISEFPKLKEHKAKIKTAFSGLKEKKQESFYIVHKDHKDWVLGYKGSSSELFFSPHTAPETFYSQDSIDQLMKKYPWIKDKGVIVPANESLGLESLESIKESLDIEYKKFLENVSVDNVNGIGHVSFPGDPSTQNEFPSQGAGSGDNPFPLGATSCGHVYTQKPANPVTLTGQQVSE